MRKSILYALLCITPCLVAVPFFVGAHTLNPKIIERLTGETITYDQHTAVVAEADPRDASRRFYTLPEWHIVYTALEYGAFVSRGGQPSDFPYFQNTKQLWWLWGEASRVAGVAPDPTTNTVLWTIALSTALEQGIIGLYESTIGSFFEGMHFGVVTAEDVYVNSVAVEYAQSLNHTPWYLFPYGEKLRGLWSTWRFDSFTPRAVERRVAFTIGYSLKAVYANLIGYMSGAHFEGGASALTEATVIGIKAVTPSDTVRIVSLQEDGTAQIAMPRYRAFLSAAQELARENVQFVTIEDHDAITFSIVKSDEHTCPAIDTYRVITIPILSQPQTTRAVYDIPIKQLHTVFASVEQCGLAIEHLYDF